MSDDEREETTETDPDAEPSEVGEVHPVHNADDMSQEHPLLFGELILHFETRDVRVLLDWDAARRLLTGWQRRTAVYGDVLTRVAPGASAWVVFEPRGLLGMSWLPGLPTAEPRVAIDPALPRHAATTRSVPAAA